MQEEWRALSNELGLSNRVTFAGRVEDDALPGYYQQADIFVLPANARSEAFGTVLLEAMASGLPCITTELGTGTSWVVQDGKTGFVVLPKDPSALARAINKFLTNKSLLQQFSQASLDRVRTGFSQDKMISNVMEVYTNLLA
jgi:rhamnosyl/mannosyltransferase